MCNEYNGWTNYQTWNVKLWLDNEEYIANEVLPGLARQHESISALADAIKDFVEDPDNGLVPDVQTGIGADLLTMALGIVDWHAIAEAVKENL